MIALYMYMYMYVYVWLSVHVHVRVHVTVSSIVEFLMNRLSVHYTLPFKYVRLKGNNYNVLKLLITI